MDYSRRQFLKLTAAGLPVALAAPLLLRGTEAEAETELPKKFQGPGRGVKVLEIKQQYNEDAADDIHERAVERRIRAAGETREQVMERINRRISSLKVG